MAQRIVVIGGGAAGIGAAGAAKGTDPSADVRVYTEFEDVGYSPCGIPYVHGREIPDFERLFLATRETYDSAGIDIRYETRVTGFDTGRKTVSVQGEGEVGYDKLIVATGFDYADPGVPGTDLGNLYYVKNIRRAIEWDKVLDGVKSAVVVEASPLGLEMVTALCHRGIETHLVDPGAWALSVATDPDIIAPVQDSWREKGATQHFNTTLTGFAGTGPLYRPTVEFTTADGTSVTATSPFGTNPRQGHTIELVVDRLVIREGIEDRLTESLQTAVKHSGGPVIVTEADDGDWHDDNVAFVNRLPGLRCRDLSNHKKQNRDQQSRSHTLEIDPHCVSLQSLPKANEAKILRRAWVSLRKQSSKSPPRTISSK